MNTPALAPNVNCPFCYSMSACPHLIGFSEDGKTMNRRNNGTDGGRQERVLPTDRIVSTRNSKRVYRQGLQPVKAAD